MKITYEELTKEQIGKLEKTGMLHELHPELVDKNNQPYNVESLTEMVLLED